MYLGQASEIVVKLYESSMYEYEAENTPVVRASGIEYEDITVETWKHGSLVLQSHTVLPSDWTELGNGLYILRLPSTIFNTIGNMFIRITGPMIRDYEREMFVEPTPLAFTPIPDMCIITGNTIDLGGNSALDTVVFTVVNVPKRVGGSLVSSRPITIHADPLGNFAVKLLMGSTVKVQIQSAGINHQIIVPNQANALLLDLLPTIP